MSIGDNIKRIRKEKGIKAKDLAKNVGVSQSMVSQWENGKREPVKFETVERIAKALNVNVYELYPAAIFDEFPDMSINEIGKHFYKLNENGKKEAVKRVYELTLIKEYTDPFIDMTENGRIKIKDTD